MRADRLLSALLLLQAKGRVTGRELAERLEVSERTIHRDMEALSASRVPISAVRGAQGGWELQKGWRTHVPALDEAELRALMMAQPRAIGHPRLAAAAESAMNKLMAALPGPMREAAAAMRERLHVDPTGWRATGEDLSMLNKVQDAVARERKLAFDYTRADGQSGPRTVDPLGLVAKGSTWYLIARAPHGVRTYRVSRMESVTALASGFERPARFELAAYWKESTAQLEAQRQHYAVTLQVAPEALRRLAGWCATQPVEANGDAANRAGGPDGWVTLAADFESEEQARSAVLWLGARARLLGPDRLRRLVLADAEAIVARFAEKPEA